MRKCLAEFKGIPATDLPEGIMAELRPYQKAGFDFLCHLSRHRLGGILADDMGLGKTLQTLAWLAWLQARSPDRRPSLVILPGVGAAQLAARGGALHAQHQDARAGERGGAA